MRLSSGFRAALIAVTALVGAGSAAHADEGFIQFNVVKAGFVVGGSGGSGVLTFHGRSYPVSIGGLSYGFMVGVSETKFRGRVMGVRMLAIYGLPLGLLAAGGLIERFGFTATATGYCLIGLLLTLVIGIWWRAALWPPDAPANAR